MSFEIVNNQFLQHLAAAGSSHDIQACEDIYSDTGVKLLANGSSLGGDIQARLLHHKLRRPLEHSIRVADAPNNRTLLDTFNQILDQDPILAHWASRSGITLELQEALQRLTLPDCAWSALAIACYSDPKFIEHGLRVTLIAISTAQVAGQAWRHLLPAALLHDIGYLYLSPALWQAQQPIGPGEWKQLSAHPIIGQMWAQNVAGLGSEVASLIACHHERADESGYPRQIGGERFGPVAEILALAEMVSGMLEHRSYPLGQLRIAFKLLPGQFTRQTRQAALSGTQDLPAGEAPAISAEKIEAALHQLLLRFGQALEVLEQLDWHCTSHVGRQLKQRLSDRLNVIQRAFTSAGLDVWLPEAQRETDPNGAVFWNELAWIIRETNWHTRHLARDLTRQCLLLPQSEAHAFEPLAGLFLALSDELTRVGL